MACMDEKVRIMKHTKWRLILCGVLLMLLLVFIWGNSAMPGQTSGQLSGWVGQLLRKLLPFLPLDTGYGMHILRKLAHFSEFAGLGMCLGWLFGMLTEKRSLWLILPLSCGIVAAAIDETIQIFSPGRNCSIVDVGIDSSGVLTGLMVLFLIHALWKRLRGIGRGRTG